MIARSPWAGERREFGFLSEDPLAGWLPRNRVSPGEVNEVYRYTGNDPVLNRDPLGLKKCGPVPSPGPGCEANCAAAMEWGLCNLHNNMSSLIYTEIAFGGGGAAAGALCFGPPGALIGAGAGLVIGIGFHHYFYVPAAEAAIRRAYDNCVRQCQTMECGDTGEGPCGQPSGGPKGPSTQ